jgi:hypothetical protein
MADALAPISNKLKPLIRLLSSDVDGEVVAAARALNKALKNAGLDIHALADGVGSSDLSKADMQVIYDAGFDAGRRSSEAAPTFHNVNGGPDWHTIAKKCAAYPPHRFFGEHEKTFIAKMVRKTEVGIEPTPKEASWLHKIYMRAHR